MSQVRGTRVWVRTAQSALLGAERTMTAPRPRLAADRALSSAAVAATSLAIQAGSSPVRCVSRRCFAAGASPAPFGSGWFDAVTKGDSMVGMLPEIQEADKALSKLSMVAALQSLSRAHDILHSVPDPRATLPLVLRYLAVNLLQRNFPVVEVFAEELLASLRNTPRRDRDTVFGLSLGTRSAQLQPNVRAVGYATTVADASVDPLTGAVTTASDGAGAGGVTATAKGSTTSSTTGKGATQVAVESEGDAMFNVILGTFVTTLLQLGKYQKAADYLGDLLSSGFLVGNPHGVCTALSLRAVACRAQFVAAAADQPYPESRALRDRLQLDESKKSAAFDEETDKERAAAGKPPKAQAAPQEKATEPFVLSTVSSSSSSSSSSTSSSASSSSPYPPSDDLFSAASARGLTYTAAHSATVRPARVTPPLLSLILRLHKNAPPPPPTRATVPPASSTAPSPDTDRANLPFVRLQWMPLETLELLPPALQAALLLHISALHVAAVDLGPGHVATLDALVHIHGVLHYMVPHIPALEPYASDLWYEACDLAEKLFPCTQALTSPSPSSQSSSTASTQPPTTSTPLASSSPSSSPSSSSPYSAAGAASPSPSPPPSPSSSPSSSSASVPAPASAPENPVHVAFAGPRLPILPLLARSSSLATLTKALSLASRFLPTNAVKTEEAKTRLADEYLMVNPVIAEGLYRSAMGQLATAATPAAIAARTDCVVGHACLLSRVSYGGQSRTKPAVTALSTVQDEAVRDLLASDPRAPLVTYDKRACLRFFGGLVPPVDVTSPAYVPPSYARTPANLSAAAVNAAVHQMQSLAATSPRAALGATGATAAASSSSSSSSASASAFSSSSLSALVKSAVSQTKAMAGARASTPENEEDELAGPPPPRLEIPMPNSADPFAQSRVPSPAAPRNFEFAVAPSPVPGSAAASTTDGAGKAGTETVEAAEAELAAQRRAADRPRPHFRPLPYGPYVESWVFERYAFAH